MEAASHLASKKTNSKNTCLVFFLIFLLFLFAEDQVFYCYIANYVFCTVDRIHHYDDCKQI